MYKRLTLFIIFLIVITSNVSALSMDRTVYDKIFEFKGASVQYFVNTTVEITLIPSSSNDFQTFTITEYLPNKAKLLKINVDDSNYLLSNSMLHINGTNGERIKYEIEIPEESIYYTFYGKFETNNTTGTTQTISKHFDPERKYVGGNNNENTDNLKYLDTYVNTGTEKTTSQIITVSSSTVSPLPTTETVEVEIAPLILPSTVSDIPLSEQYDNEMSSKMEFGILIVFIIILIIVNKRIKMNQLKNQLKIKHYEFTFAYDPTTVVNFTEHIIIKNEEQHSFKILHKVYGNIKDIVSTTPNEAFLLPDTERKFEMSFENILLEKRYSGRIVFYKVRTNKFYTIPIIKKIKNTLGRLKK